MTTHSVHDVDLLGKGTLGTVEQEPVEVNVRVQWCARVKRVANDVANDECLRILQALRKVDDGAGFPYLKGVGCLEGLA